MANIKISELNPLLTVQDADVLPIVDNAVTKKVTAAILKSYTQGNSVLLTGAQTVAGIKTFTSQLASSVATGTAPFSVASTTKVTNLNADLLDGLSSADFQATLSGTGIVKSTAGTISYLTDNTANWDTAYNDKINSAAVTGSGTNTLTLTQQDAGTITATWVNGTLIREVRNTTGATLTKGTIVYISGATGNKPTVTKAIASGDSTSAQTFGFIQSDLANNANGYVVVVGDLTGVDTSAFAEGDQLYLSSTVAGAFTSTKQYAPAHLVYVGIVTRSHPTLGQIEVNIQNGYELDELHNVSAQSPSNGDILQYVSSTNLWTKTAGTTSNIAEGSNLYYTDSRARLAFSESVTGLDYNSTTGVLSTTSGYGIPTTASQATWDTAYNDSIVSAAVTGTTTKTLTLNQQDGGTVTASWTDINTDAVSSVFGRTGAVVAASGDYTTTQVTEGTNLYFTDARARAAISLTTTGTSGAATYSGGVLNIPQYQAALTNPITGTGTTNYLPKFTGTSALGNSIISDSAGVATIAGVTKINVGEDAIDIGTPSGNSYRSNLILRGTNASASLETAYFGLNVFSSDGSLDITNSNNIVFRSGGSTERMRITSAGNVGIGTASPAYKLDVSGEANLRDYLLIGNSQSYFGDNGVIENGTADGNTRIQYFNTKYLAFKESGTERMRIAAGGNLLIGTTTDAGYKLDVNGTARVSGALDVVGTVTAYRYQSISSNASLVGYGVGTGLGMFNAGTDTLGFATASTNRLTIDGTGAATFSSSVTATSFIKSGGTSSQFLKADGSVDSTTYQASLLSNPDGIVAIQSGAIKIEPTAQTLSLGESYATNLKNYFFTNSYEYAPSPVGYEYAKLIQQDLLNPASLILIPSAYKTGKVAVSKPTIDLDFTRSNDTATRVNEYGLIEKVRTNVILQSNNFDTTWVSNGGSGSTVTSGQADPDGGTSAWLFAKLSQTGRREQTITTAANEQTFSIIAKKGSSNFLNATVYDNTTAHEVYFNLDNGSVGTQTNAVGSIVSLGSGWYRCSVTSTNASATGLIQLYISDANGSVSGTTGDIYIYQSQFENGVATNYIPTTSSAVSVGPVANVPRMDYTDSASPRLLLEPQRTNLVFFSEQMTLWVNGAASVTANATTSPDGYQNADRINNTTDVSTFVSASNGVYTFSLFVKQGTSATASIDMSDGATGDVFTTFTFATKTFSGTSAGGSWASPSTAYQDYGNGWYRISLTATKGAGSSIGHKINASGTGTTFVWGAQLEAGAYATSYIPTLGAAVTRGADATYKTGISSLIGQTEGTLFADVDLELNGDSAGILAITGVNTTFVYLFTAASTNLLNANVYVNGTQEASMTYTLPSAGRYKIAIGYKTNDFVLYVNGVQRGNDNNGIVPACSDLNIISTTYNILPNIKHSQALIFPTRLTNAELATLTTI